MKKDLLTILCMTLVCASVMLGIMGIYRIVGIKTVKTLENNATVHSTAFKVRGISYTA